MNFTTSPFDINIKLPSDTQIIFVSDMFVKDYVGGAELTTQALIDASPYKIFCVNSSRVNQKLIRDGLSLVWVFGNFSQIDPNLIPIITNNLKYYILEYDYKYCKYRSPEKHKASEGKECDCHLNQNGKLICNFYSNAKSVFWMSLAQMTVYLNKFQEAIKFNNILLSSVFDDLFFNKIIELNKKYSNITRKGWIVLGSQSWVKGYENAVSWCQENKVDYEVVWNLPYEQLLEKLAQSEGFVYLPNGADTCPRMVIEAKLLGCKLYINEHVQNAQEKWFNTNNINETLNYLMNGSKRFWDEVNNSFKSPTISGYTTTYNCASQGYPFEESIKSLLQFCDEVCVVDGGSTDDTIFKLMQLSALDTRIKLQIKRREWNHPRFARFDGEQKAEARKMCTSDFCWQMDVDEIVDEIDATKIKNLVKQFPTQADILALPVIEFWGCNEKVRCDVNPWKWRLSRNLPHITHGIPAQLRQYDENGELYAKQGTDGCDYIDVITGEPILFIGFYTQEVHDKRMQALNGNMQALDWYQQWFNLAVSQLPGVWHFSWFDLGRKIRTYRDYWSAHWESLSGNKVNDTPENNMFFNKAWKDVSEQEIDELAVRLSTEMGGWIFHQRIDFSRKTPWLKVNKLSPTIMRKWMTSHAK
jgi:glycosyltransferase involved in cell wall biosynthesis